ncbi:MAG: acyltransferase family protein [Mucilaginibacter sp.]
MRYLNKTWHKFSAEITAVPDYLQGRNYPALTGVRGVAIVIVLLYHLGINRLLRHFDGWLVGRMGVDIFFVLSGFLITTLLTREKIESGHIALKQFYIRRALRIVPVAYLFLVVMLLVNHFFDFGINAKSFIYGFLYLKNLPISGINDNWTTHLWSVSVEVQFYLLFPLLLWIDINKAAMLAAIAVIGILICSLLGFNHIGIFYSNAALYTFCRAMMDAFWEGPFAILIGCLFSILAFNGIINTGRFKNVSFLTCLLFIIAVIIRSRTFYFYTTYLSEFLFDVLIGFVIVLSIDSHSWFTRLLNTRFLFWMGTLSYSIYIWQQIFVWMPAPWPDSDFAGRSGIPLFLLVEALRLAGMIGTACLSYYFFERKFLKLKTRFT